MARGERKRFPRPIGARFEDGSFRTVGGKVFDPDSGRLRKKQPSGIARALMRRK